MHTKNALNVIYNAITPFGILASSVNQDNYARIWSRDSMMTGIAGILIKDEKIVEAHKNSILTLAENQSENGQIPSNVMILNNEKSISFGTLVGRIDATTWWIIGTCKYLEFSQDKAFEKQILPNITKAFSCLKTWEFNNRGFIYTPLGGNWADEYITQGYTLYDNVLRYWALHLAGKIFHNEEWKNEAVHLKISIESNFKKNNNSEKKYHSIAYHKAEEKPYYWSHFSANGYETLFDMAGNALALLLDFEFDLISFENFLNKLHLEFGHWMLPVFYPVIHSGDKNWDLLENNYNYHFKNIPYHFHNGGSWPVFLGWLCLALKNRNRKEISDKIVSQYETLLKEKNDDFHEYFSTDSLEASGTNKLCFSAVGYLLMKHCKEI